MIESDLLNLISSKSNLALLDLLKDCQIGKIKLEPNSISLIINALYERSLTENETILFDQILDGFSEETSADKFENEELQQLTKYTVRKPLNYGGLKLLASALTLISIVQLIIEIVRFSYNYSTVSDTVDSILLQISRFVAPVLIFLVAKLIRGFIQNKNNSRKSYEALG